MIVVMIVVMIISTVVVVITVVFMIPMAFMYLPALLVVVVVGMAPVGAGVRRPLPAAGDPDVAAATGAPIAVNPSVAFSGHGRPYLIAHWWRCAEVDLDLTERRGC
jgi:hypothetical protein